MLTCAVMSNFYHLDHLLVFKRMRCAGTRARRSHVKLEAESYERLVILTACCSCDGYCTSAIHADHIPELSTCSHPTVCFISFALLRGNLQCLWRDDSSVYLPSDHQTSLQPCPLTAACTTSLSSSSHRARKQRGRKIVYI